MALLCLPLSSSSCNSLFSCLARASGTLIWMQYIGQAAFISRDPSAFSNPFYNTVPPKMFYPSLVFAIAAAVVASQTMITATFQVCSIAQQWSKLCEITLLVTAPGANHQAIIFSTNQDCTYFKDFPRPDLHSVGQLASLDRYSCCHSNLQQCKFPTNLVLVIMADI